MKTKKIAKELTSQELIERIYNYTVQIEKLQTMRLIFTKEIIKRKKRKIKL